MTSDKDEKHINEINSNQESDKSLDILAKLGFHPTQVYSMETGLPIDPTELESDTEKCWRTGVFSGDSFCEFCDHKYECSGYEHYDDD